MGIVAEKLYGCPQRCQAWIGKPGSIAGEILEPMTGGFPFIRTGVDIIFIYKTKVEASLMDSNVMECKDGLSSSFIV